MRRPSNSRVVALAAVLAVAFAVHSKVSAGQADDGGRGYSEHDWLFAGGNWSSSRYSTLAEISTETIDRLGGAWFKRLDGGASSRATPVVLDGVIYLSAGANVFAGCVATSGLRRQDGPPLASTVPGPPSCPATIRSNGASSNPPSSSSAFGGTCGMP